MTSTKHACNININTPRYEPRHEKTCFPDKKLARGLKLHTETVRMRRLICTFVGRIWQNMFSHDGARLSASDQVNQPFPNIGRQWNLKDLSGCEVRIENSVTRVNVRH